MIYISCLWNYLWTMLLQAKVLVYFYFQFFQLFYVCAKKMFFFTFMKYFLQILFLIHTSHAYYLDFTHSFWNTSLSVKTCCWQFKWSFTINFFPFNARSNRWVQVGLNPYIAARNRCKCVCIYGGMSMLLFLKNM
jgi:hypothetical protein